ncbi:MAG: hypothetical protein QOE97_544 [Pseudonocardiales bacterium]|nr:hypothetical protein [Pseudonocardiales bacterium]
MTTDASDHSIVTGSDPSPDAPGGAGPAVIEGVDFSMMYAAHGAFERHLDRMLVALERDRIVTPAVLAQWELFDRQLHLHHTAEDTALWPPLQAAVHAADELAVLDAMAAEHAAIDPALEAIGDRLEIGDASATAIAIAALRSGLVAHMRHEEGAALPLVARRLGPSGWAAFGRHMRETQGMRGASTYLPWLLDGAPASTVAAVLGGLPRPVRLLYRVLWLPRYRRRLA